VPSYRRLLVCILALLMMGASATVVPGAAAATLGSRTLRMGSSGPDVKQLQNKLRKAGYKISADGQFGRATFRAVKSFQRSADLAPTGTADRRTIRALRRMLHTAQVGGFDPNNPSKAAPAKNLGDRVPIKRGMKGPDVKQLQALLRKTGQSVAVDGAFGPGTQAAVKGFEAAANRAVDGIVDTDDITALKTMAAQPAPAATTTTTPVALAPGAHAKIGSNGLAIAPASAPAVVQAIVNAGNQIATKPYVYGGGHARWIDSGYDCSGSVSYALHGAGLLAHAMPSGSFESWGDPGPGQWVTIYAKASHMFMVVAGIRFDTSGRSIAGTRWQAAMRDSSGYVVRHPPGL
jgi:peptidoglycan hydrolase-like protein with peptidoglycan-binding domain